MAPRLCENYYFCWSSPYFSVLGSQLRQDRVQVFLSQLGFREVRRSVVGCFNFAKEGSQFREGRFSQPFNRLVRVNVFAVGPIETQLPVANARYDIQQVGAVPSQTLRL